MHQAISLLSGSFPNLILDIPVELLAIILSDIHPDGEVNKALGILTMVSKCLTRKIFQSLEYIRIAAVSRCELVRHLSGLTRLLIIGDGISLSSFNKNIWGNLKYLIIPAYLINQLNMSHYPDMFVQNPDILIQNPNVPEGEIHTSSTLSSHSLLPYGMKNLSRIRIKGDNVRGDAKFKINPLLIPNVSWIELSKCRILNIDEFKGLKKLVLIRTRNITKFSQWLNGIQSSNLEFLILLKVVGRSQMVISMPALKGLFVDKYNYDLDISGCVNLRILNVRFVGRVIIGRMANLQHLILNESRFVWYDQPVSISDELFPSLEIVEVYWLDNERLSSIKVISDRILENKKIGSGFMVLLERPKTSECQGLSSV